MVSSSLIKTFAFAFVGQLIPASIFIPLQTEKYYDLCGSLGFLTTTLFSLIISPINPPLLSVQSAKSNLSFIRSKLSNILLQSSSSSKLKSTETFFDQYQNSLIFNRHPRQIIMSACVLIWSIRLGTFLFKRIQNIGHDKRFDKIKKDFIVFSFAWFMQFVWITLTALPVYMINSLPSKIQPSIGIMDYFGFSIWLIGLFFEIIADQTKSQWRKEKDLKKHKEQFIQRGIWSFCRHPNYFGEIVLWIGLAIITFSIFSNNQIQSYCGNHYSTLLTFSPFLSPLFEYVLIRHLSGVPILERNMDKKMKGDKKYAQYKRDVPCFIPFIGSKD